MATNVGEIYYEVDMELGALLTGQRQADKALNDLEKSFEKTNKSSQSLDTGLTKLASTIKAVIAASVLREMAGLRALPPPGSRLLLTPNLHRLH